MENVVVELVRDIVRVDKDYKISLDTKVEDLQVSSLEFVRMILRMEEFFNIEFEIEDLLLSKFHSIEDFVTVIKKRLDMKENGKDL